jgi:hypothetical protein
LAFCFTQLHYKSSSCASANFYSRSIEEITHYIFDLANSTFLSFSFSTRDTEALAKHASKSNFGKWALGGCVY